jgi:hypothetical protein
MVDIDDAERVTCIFKPQFREEIRKRLVKNAKERSGN